jgi:hypothetical protein
MEWIRYTRSSALFTITDQVMPKPGSILSVLLLATLLFDPILRIATSGTEDTDALAGYTNKTGESDGVPRIVHPTDAVHLGALAEKLPVHFGIKSRSIWPPGLRALFRPGKKRARVAWNLRSELARGRASLQNKEKRRDCAEYDGTRFHCGPRPHQFVGFHAGPFRGFDAPCVWMHPIRDQKLILKVPGLPKFNELRGYIGLLDEAKKRAKVDVTIHVGGREIAREKLVRDDGVHEISATLPKGVMPNLEIRVTTSNPRGRMVCLDLFGLRWEEK